jgi:hypothetical protein
VFDGSHCKYLDNDDDNDDGNWLTILQALHAQKQMIFKIKGVNIHIRPAY